MKLTVMTQQAFFVEEDKIITSLFDEGLDSLHVRKPGAEPMLSERLLTLLHEENYGKTIVHGHFYLKSEFGLRGIHLESPDAQPPSGYKGQLGRTCHAIEELKDTKRNADYVFLAHVFGPNAAFTADELEQAARHGLIDKRVWCLGGITVDTLRTARELGFGGAVVCSDLWSRFDIQRQHDYKEILAHFDKLRKAAD